MSDNGKTIQETASEDICTRNPVYENQPVGTFSL